MLLLCLILQRFTPDGGLFVGEESALREQSASPIMKLGGVVFDLDAFQQIEGHVVVEGDTAYAFSKLVWQSAKIKSQIKLYSDLARGNLGSPEIREFESAVFKWAGIQPPPLLHPKITVERSFVVERSGDKLSVVLRTPRRAAAAKRVVDWPNPVVRYSSAESTSDPWVQYPTTYSFHSFGKIYGNPDRYYPARQKAIALLDAHIDEFMADRQKRIDAIATETDQLTLEGPLGRRVQDLNSDLNQRLTAAIGKGDPPRPPEWVRGATLKRAETRLLLEESYPDGSVVEIAVP